MRVETVKRRRRPDCENVFSPQVFFFFFFLHLSLGGGREQSGSTRLGDSRHDGTGTGTGTGTTREPMRKGDGWPLFSFLRALSPTRMSIHVAVPPREELTARDDGVWVARGKQRNGETRERMEGPGKMRGEIGGGGGRADALMDEPNVQEFLHAETLVYHRCVHDEEANSESLLVAARRVGVAREGGGDNLHLFIFSSLFLCASVVFFIFLFSNPPPRVWSPSSPSRAGGRSWVPLVWAR